MSVIKAFLFDMDGVVTDTEPQYDKFLAKIRDEYKLPSDFLDQIKGTRLPDILARYFSGFSEEERKQIENRVINFELNEMKYEPIEGVLDFIRLAESNTELKIALVTSSLRIKTKVALKELNLENTFDTVVTADDVTSGKPDPQCYLLAAQRLGVKPEECLVFEDSFAGIEAGKKAGMYVVGVSTTNPEEELKKEVTRVIPDFISCQLEDLLTEK